MSRLTKVQVCVDLDRFAHPAPMSSLRVQASSTGEIFSFEYAPSWLQQPESFALDPDPALMTSPQYPAPERASFNIFADSSPDRWGRVLMQRRENIDARRDKRRARALNDWDCP